MTIFDEERGIVMKTWKFIELADAIGHGVTEDGFPFCETEVQGWNDDEDFSDMEDLLTIRAVEYDTEVKVYQYYSDPDVKTNITVMRLAKDAVQLLAKHIGVQ